MNPIAQTYFANVCVFADSIGMRGNLDDALRYLGSERPDRVLYLFSDFAPYSFDFTVCAVNSKGEEEFLFNGGIIFHGAHDNGGDGGAPTYSVSLNPRAGWQVHT